MDKCLLDYGFEQKKKLILRIEKIKENYFLLKAVNKNKLISKRGLIHISFTNKKEFDRAINEFCEDYYLNKEGITIENG